MTCSRRRARIAALILPAALWLAQGPPVRPVSAQQPAGPEPLDVLHVAGNVHMIAGDGGNIAVQVGADGVVLVDTGAGRRSTEVLAAIGRLSDQPIRYVINTSGHPEYAGGNATISAEGQALGAGNVAAAALAAGVRTGAARLAHENVLLWMSRPAGDSTRAPEAAWPTEGFIDKKYMVLNNEAIQIYHQPAAHSDGDSIVFFRRSDVVAAGALIDSTRFPVIDVDGGGTIQGLIRSLNTVVDLAIPPTPLVWHPGGTQVIPGIGRVMEQADVVDYRDMVTIVRDVVQDMARRGMTLDQIKAANPTAGYTRRYGADSGSWTTDMFVEAIYRTLPREGGTR